MKHKVAKFITFGLPISIAVFFIAAVGFELFQQCFAGPGGDTCFDIAWPPSLLVLFSIYYWAFSAYCDGEDE